MINDPVGDFLTRIRNAQLRKKEAIILPHNKLIESIANILKKEAFISDFEVIEVLPQNEIRVFLKYDNDIPVIRDLVRVSKPGVRKYRGYREIKAIKNGQGVSIFSTPAGVITGDEARDKKIGGEFICYVY